MEPKTTQFPEPGELTEYFQSARQATLPSGLERRILLDADRYQPRRSSTMAGWLAGLAQNLLRNGRAAAVLAVSAIAGLTVGLSSVSAVELFSAGFGSTSEIAEPDIFAGLDEMLLGK